MNLVKSNDCVLVWNFWFSFLFSDLVVVQIRVLVLIVGFLFEFLNIHSESDNSLRIVIFVNSKYDTDTILFRTAQERYDCYAI